MIIGQNLQLLRSLNPFGRDRKTERLGQRKNCLNDGATSVIALQMLDELTIDLEHIELKHSEITERRITRSEIVDRKPHSQALELSQDRTCLLQVGNEHALRD